MSPIRDSQLIVRTGTAILYMTAAEFAPTGGLDIEGTVLEGMALHILIPTIHDTVVAPIMTVEVYANSTSACADTTSELIAARSGIGAVGEYIIPFSTRKRSVGFNFLGTSASGYFSNLQAWVTLNYGQDWTRTVEWH